MPRLPTKHDLGGLPSARTGRGVASFDETAIGAGVSALGKGIASAGDDISKALALEQERDDNSWFIRERANTGAHWATRMPQAKVESGEGAPTLVPTIEKEHDAYTERVLSTAPSSRARETYARWAAAYGAKLRGDAAGFATSAAVTARESRYKDAFEAHRRAVYNNPAMLKETIAAAEDDLVGMKRDLPPKMLTGYREKLKKDLTEAAVMGLLERGDTDGARALTGTGGYIERMIVAESSGRADAANDKSSSAGLAGFLSSTWVEWFDKVYPDDKGMSREKKLAFRSDRKRTMKVAAAYTAASRKILSSNGLPINNTTLYALHFFGQGGGPEFLKADDSLPIGKVVPASKIKANPWMKGMTVGEVKAKLAGKMGGSKSAIPLGRALQLENMIDRVETSREKAADLELRLKTVTEGYDLMRMGTLTTEWLTDHKDDIGLGDYKVFSRALTEEGIQKPDPKRTDPKEYIELLELADSDPEEAIAKVKDAYGSGRIAKDVFNRVFSRANGNMNEKTRRPAFIRSMRSYLNSFLTAETRRRDGSKRAHARHLDSMFIFDDHVAANKDIKRDELRRFTEELIGNYREMTKKARKEYIPMPPFFGTGLTREDVTIQHLNMSRALLIRKAREGEISKAEAAQQARLLKEWFSILEAEAKK